MESRKLASGRVMSREQQELLSKRINELPLTIKGSYLEACVAKLYQEMERAGICFKPKTYLTDGWGCPDKVPVIGIPFYLADQELCSLQAELNDTSPVRNEVETMMVLRHEAGHAFNYAYRLYVKPEWRQLFGPFSQPYKDIYVPVPFSLRFVHHSSGWYAQKHPDDDFAETFAVWLTPGTEWRRQYDGTPALAKLLYVDRMARKYGQQPPAVTDGKLDLPLQEMTMTLDEWYEKLRESSHVDVPLHNVLNNDLRRLFPAEEGESAADVLLDNRTELIQEVNHWTGMDRSLLTALIDELLRRVQLLELKIKPEEVHAQMLSTSVFVTTLVMNHLCRGRFVDI